ncbi:IclR family transcriptional regulator [Paracoccus sp. (in: a-proteobacteria)]|uniref:IclR family transcriptional regulator n=1 Tax=Paracoccus sp. TaxID=267 RepID=UPI003A8634F7
MAREGQAARGIQSISVGGRILQALIDASNPLTLREISQVTDITSAQAHAYLVSYKRVGMVVQEFDGGPYLLGSLALRLGLGRLRSLSIFRETNGLLKELSEELNVMSLLAVWTSKGPSVAMMVQARDKRSDLNIHMGTRFSVLNTATGRIFGAFDDPARVGPWISSEVARAQPTHYETDVTSLKSYEALMATIRKDGISVVKGVRVPGIDAVAVPIFDENNAFAGALTCIGHADTLDTAKDSACVKTILSGVSRMSERLLILDKTA